MKFAALENIIKIIVANSYISRCEALTKIFLEPFNTKNDEKRQLNQIKQLKAKNEESYSTHIEFCIHGFHFVKT